MAIERPERYRRKHLPTLADAVDRLLGMEEINPAESRAVNRAVAAVKSANASFASYSSSSFRFFNSRKILTIGGSISVGTATVSGDSVTVENVPTWPSWVNIGHLRMNEASYPILSESSDTLTIRDAPEDGTYENAYLEQLVVSLPPDFRARGSITDGGNNYAIEDVNAGVLQSWQDYGDWSRSDTQPRGFAAVTGDERFSDELMLMCWPPYASDTQLKIYYERYPNQPRVHRFSTTAGTISVSGTTATASASVFTEDHVGSTIAFCSSNDTDFVNSLSNPDLLAGQRTITGYSNGTTVTIDSSITSTAVSYYISDPLDVQPGTMTEAFLRLCEYEMIRQSRGESGKVATRFNEFMTQMNLAMADDSRYLMSRDDGEYPGYGYAEGDVNTIP